MIEVITRDEEARNPTRACFQVVDGVYNRYISTRRKTPEGKDIAIVGCIVKLEDDPYKTERYQQYLNMYRRRRYQRVFKHYRPDEWRLVDPYAQYFPSIP